MSEYAPGTILEDKDGDRWKVQRDTSQLRALLGDKEEDFDSNLLGIEQNYGPLRVVEEHFPVWGQKYLANRDRTTYETKDGSVEFRTEVPRTIVDKAQESSGDTFAEDAFSVYEESFKILLRKNADYGPRNIADSPGGPLNGILVRSWDKMARLKNLIGNGVDPENESIRDTFLDLANYSLIAMMVLDGNWPGMKEDK